MCSESLMRSQPSFDGMRQANNNGTMLNNGGLSSRSIIVVNSINERFFSSSDKHAL